MGDERVLVLGVGVLAGVILWTLYRDQQAATAGDEASNILTDTMDTMKSKFNGGWPAGSEPYQTLIAQAAQNNGVPVEILAWLLWKESRYNPDVIDGTVRSRVGALGIAQFMPATAHSLDIDPLDPEEAIPAAAAYLASGYRSLGTWAGALAAYNWGIGNMQRKGIAQAPAETVDYYTTILSKAGYEATA